MSDAENSDSPTEDGSAKDSSTPTPHSSTGDDGSSAPSDDTDRESSPSLSLPTPGDKKLSASRAKRPSLSERIRKLVDKQKKQKKRADDDPSDNVGFVSSLTATPPPSSPSTTEPSTPDSAKTAGDIDDGDDEVSAFDGEPDVAPTDRVTSLPFDVIDDADFETEDDIDTDSTQFITEEEVVTDSARFETQEEVVTDSARFETQKEIETADSTDPMVSPAVELIDDSTDRMAAPVDTEPFGDDSDLPSHFEATSPTDDGPIGPRGDSADVAAMRTAPDDGAPASDATAPASDTTAPASDASSEFEAEDTEIFDSAFDNDPISPRLSTLEGPAVGQDFLVNRMRNSIGRGTANSISVPDPAMSRMHFEIVQNPDDTYLIKDLRAVNGTSLNGVPIQEADLFHGDRIEVGQTTFQFVIPGDAPVDDRQRHLVPAATTETAAATGVDELTDSGGASIVTPNRGVYRLLLFVTITAAVLSIPLLGFLLHVTILDADGADEEVSSVSARELYFEGVEAFRDRDLDRAEELFLESRRVDSDFDLPDAQLERIEDERAAGELIEEAAARTDEEFDDDLLDELRAIPRNSHYYQDAQDKLNRVPHNEARLLFVDAQRAFDEDELDRSAELVEKVRDIEPQHEGARRLEAAIAERRDASDEEPDDASGGAVAAPATPPPSSQAVEEGDSESALFDSPFASGDDGAGASSTSSSSHSGNINFMDGFNLYRGEQLQEAIGHFDAIVESSSGTIAERAQRTADNIRDFKHSRRAGDDALTSGDYDAAIDHFERAIRADESVVAGGSFHSPLAEKLSESLGRAGLQKLERRDYSGAYDNLQRAETYGPDHRQTTTLRSELDDTAHSLYDRATSKKDTNPEEASRLFEAITTMVSPSSDLHRSARGHLEALP